MPQCLRLILATFQPMDRRALPQIITNPIYILMLRITAAAWTVDTVMAAVSTAADTAEGLVAAGTTDF